MPSRISIIDDVVRAAQLASALEVCGWPKPGNVHRTADFKDIRFEHFIAGSIAILPIIRKTVINGLKASKGKIGLERVMVGSAIYEAINEVQKWHKGSNTHLGISMLLIPLSSAYGFAYGKHGKVSINSWRNGIKSIVESTTPQDAVYVYKAIKKAKPGGLGKVEDKEAIDVYDPQAEKKLIEKGITLYEVMKISASWDTIAKEWVTSMQLTFEFGYPTLMKLYLDKHDINYAIVHTFLEILAKNPDSLIARKMGYSIAKEVSEKAKEVLSLGGMLTKEGFECLNKLDKELRINGENSLNPGTTADLVASSLMVAIMNGLRP
ncbi:MAG: triphosphoribosyl-dephospho-CoA synthase [Candidatus Bathyarchaeia archaeon]